MELRKSTGTLLVKLQRRVSGASDGRGSQRVARAWDTERGVQSACSLGCSLARYARLQPHVRPPPGAGRQDP